MAENDSLLGLLQRRRTGLKSVTTVVTRTDGTRYVENDPSVSVEKRSYGFVVDTKPDSIPSHVIDRLYIGSQDACVVRTILDSHGIVNVLSVGVEAPVHHPGIVYHHVPCLDLPETDFRVVLDHCNDFIERTQGNLLVHCNAGVSRSSAVLIGHLITIRKYTYEKAYDVVKQARNCTRPNDGFRKQLQEL